MSITYICKYNGYFPGRLKSEKYTWRRLVRTCMRACMTLHVDSHSDFIILLQEYNAGVGESHQRETCGSEHTSTGKSHNSHSYIHKAAHIHQTHLCPGQCIDKCYWKA